MALGVGQRGRRRLIQQYEYITRGFIASAVKLTEDELKTYFEENCKNYYVPTKITFTHVFFSSDRRTAEEAKALALSELRELNKSKVPFHEGLSHGDRFLYHANYAGKEDDEIASHFGAEMQKQVFALEPSDSEWRGPF